MTKTERENRKIEQEIEKEIRKIYKTSQAEISLKYQAFQSDFKLKSAIYEEQIRQATMKGDIKALEFAKYEYERFMKNSMFTDTHYLNMLEQVKAELLHANETAVAFANGKMPEVYAINYNGEASRLMSELKDLTGTKSMGVSWELLNPHLVRNLAMENKTLLPYKEVNGRRFERWETQRINSQMLRGIIQGESISKLADRLQNVTVMDREAAIRNARTMHTSARGRACLHAMEDGQEKGIIMKKVWEVAAFDGRLRESHAEIAGEERELDEKFSNGLMYPGDPTGEPEEVYNCRCTMTHDILGFKSVLPEEMQDSIEVQVDGQDAGEWLEQHGSGGSEGEVVDITAEPKTEEEKVDLQQFEKPDFIDRLEQSGIERNEVGTLGDITAAEIIERLAGGDMTKGSCSSLAFAYAGNRAGFDVLDFRGGKSCSYFSYDPNIISIAQMEGVESQVVKGYNDIKTVNTMLNEWTEAGKMPVGKEFYLATGRHAAIIRRTESGFEYLEMQSALRENTFYPLTENALRKRFKAQKSHTVMGTRVKVNNMLIDIETLPNNPYFKDVLEYINTPKAAQKKGASGYAK